MLLFYGMALSINAYTMDPTHLILKPYSWEAPSHDFQLVRNLLIEWNPPYSEINSNSDIVHVEPHITPYTVYIVLGDVTMTMRENPILLAEHTHLTAGTCLLFIQLHHLLDGHNLVLGLPSSLPHLPKTTSSHVIHELQISKLNL